MKTFIVAAVAIAVCLSCSIKPTLYSREIEQQRIADALKVSDSLRVADSIRIADSLMIARYHKADEVIKEERQHHKDSVFSEMFIFNNDEPVNEPLDDDTDVVSARSIVIDPDNPQMRKIDSLQAEFDRKNALLHDKDTLFKMMKTFAISEKKRYMRFLLQHKMKDTVQIAAYCNSLADLYKTQLAIFSAIQESQEGNTKSFVRRHKVRYESRMEELSEFILALTPEVPFRPSHTLRERHSSE